jgi:allantoicase
MTAARPYPDVETLLSTADAAFDQLEEADWLEAFAAHPRIGERGDRMTDLEQTGTAEAGDELMAELAGVNLAYEESMGFTYIVYATGKTAAEMLEIARGRLVNARAEEIGNAAAEQKSITRTRLRRMLCMEATR